MHLRPDLVVEPLRGNVDTRLARLEAPDGPEAVVLAAAGLERLGRIAEAAELLDPELFVPAVGQGALAIETRAGDERAISLAAAVDHQPSRYAVMAERSFLSAFGGGCSAPVAAHAIADGKKLTLQVFASDPDGLNAFRLTVKGAAKAAEELGRKAARDLIALGAVSLPPVDRSRRVPDRAAADD